jgi:hypothetical protein
MRESRVSAVRVARVECKNRKAEQEYERGYEEGRKPESGRLPQGQLRPLGGFIL